MDLLGHKAFLYFFLDLIKGHFELGCLFESIGIRRELKHIRLESQKVLLLLRPTALCGLFHNWSTILQHDRCSRVDILNLVSQVLLNEALTHGSVASKHILSLEGLYGLGLLNLRDG